MMITDNDDNDDDDDYDDPCEILIINQWVGPFLDVGLVFTVDSLFPVLDLWPSSFNILGWGWSTEQRYT